MPLSASSRRNPGHGAQRPAESPPAGSPEHNGNPRSPFLDMPIQGQKAQLHPRSAARSRVHQQQLQQGQYYSPPAGHVPDFYHPAANIFNIANQDQLLAAYVAMMQSPSGSTHGAPKQQQLQHVLSGSGGIPFLPAGAIDWNGILSHQGSIATSGRIAELMRLLPQPRFQLQRPEGPAPDTPASLQRMYSTPGSAAVAAAAMQAMLGQSLSAPGSAAAASAMHAISYAYQQHFSSYWTATGPGGFSRSGSGPGGVAGATPVHPGLAPVPATMAAGGWVPQQGYAAAAGSVFVPPPPPPPPPPRGAGRPEKQLGTVSSVADSSKANASSKGASRTTQLRSHELVAMGSAGSNNSRGSSGSSGTYHSCTSGSSNTQTPFATAHAAAATAAGQGTRSNTSASAVPVNPTQQQPQAWVQQQWLHLQQQSWSGCHSPAALRSSGSSSSVPESPMHGQWSPIYQQQYIQYLHHMQLMQQQQWQQQRGWFKPGLYRTGSDPSAAHSWQQAQHQHHPREGPHQPGRAPLAANSWSGGGNNSSSNNRSGRWKGSNAGAGNGSNAHNRRPSRLAAATFGSVVKRDRPMSAVAEGEGTLVATVGSDPTPVRQTSAAAAAAGGGGDSARRQQHSNAGGIGSSTGHRDFFLSHSGSGAAASADVAAAPAPAVMSDRQSGVVMSAQDRSSNGGAASVAAQQQHVETSNNGRGRRKWSRPQVTWSRDGRSHQSPRQYANFGSPQQQQYSHAWHHQQHFWPHSPQQAWLQHQQAHIMQLHVAQAGQFDPVLHYSYSGSPAAAAVGSPADIWQQQYLPAAQYPGHVMGYQNSNGGVAIVQHAPAQLPGQYSWASTEGGNGSGTPCYALHGSANQRRLNGTYGRHSHIGGQGAGGDYNSRSMAGNRSRAGSGNRHGNPSVRGSANASRLVQPAWRPASASGRSGAGVVGASRQRSSWGGGFRRQNPHQQQHQEATPGQQQNSLQTVSSVGSTGSRNGKVGPEVAVQPRIVLPAIRTGRNRVGSPGLRQQAQSILGAVGNDSRLPAIGVRGHSAGMHANRGSRAFATNSRSKGVDAAGIVAEAVHDAGTIGQSGTAAEVVAEEVGRPGDGLQMARTRSVKHSAAPKQSTQPAWK